MTSQNNGCACTPNKAIHCSVQNCAYHCKNEQYCGLVKTCAHHCGSQNYCSLDKIRVGTHEANPTMDQCTDCQSYKKMQ